MKREPYTTSLTKEVLRKYPAIGWMRDELELHLAVVSRTYRSKELGLMMVCRSLTERGRTIWIPRFMRRDIDYSRSIPDMIEILEFEYEPFEYDRRGDPLNVWIELGDHIVYFHNPERFYSGTGWVFGRSLEQCLRRIEERPHYRVIVDGSEIYLGLDRYGAKGLLPDTEGTEFGQALAAVTGHVPTQPEIVIESRFGPYGAWQRLEAEAEADILERLGCVGVRP